MDKSVVPRAIFTAAIGIALGAAVVLGGTSVGDADGRPSRHEVTVAPAPSPGLSSNGAAGDANRLVGWAVIAPGTPAAEYWSRHGVGVSDPHKLCEAALRVQYVRGYARLGADDSRQPLWKPACAEVSDATRDSIVIAAVEWSATHEEGDG